MYRYMCVCMMVIHLLHPSRTLPAPSVTAWPLQDIRLVRGLCTRVSTITRKHPHCSGTLPPPFLAHTITQYSGSPDPPLLQYVPHNIDNGNILWRPSDSRHAPQPTQPALRPHLGLYKRFVCWFGGCALVNSILGIQHLLNCNPPSCNLQSILRSICPPPRPPPGFVIQHTILVIAISCKGQATPHQHPEAGRTVIRTRYGPAATHPGVGGGTHRRHATFKRC